MTRNLRKRHLMMWLVLTLVLIIVLVVGRVNTPEFSGDKVVNTSGQ